jgi:hypothetical protein
MKDYGGDGNQKKEKKKKRNFEFIMNTSTHGIYTDDSLRKVAKKVTYKFVGKKKKIIFYLREINKKGKYGKTYGPYIGSIKDGKAIVRIYKMNGGDLFNCIKGLEISVNNFKADANNSPDIKINNFCLTNTTIIFFNILNFLEKNGDKYYEYVIYRIGNTVFVIQLTTSDYNELKLKRINIEQIGSNARSQIKKEKLKEIIDKIQSEKTKNPLFAERIFEEINNELQRLENESQKLSFPAPTPINNKPFSSFLRKPIKEMPLHVYNRLLDNALGFRIIKKEPIRIINKDKYLDYICSIQNPIIEINKTNSGIFFGFDPKLLIKKNGISNFYYRYGYFGNNIFKELIKNENGEINEKEINISEIPLYDLLCLMEFAINNNLSDLLSIITSNIAIQKQNESFTISLSDHTFFQLGNSNFDKKRNTNIGKIKSKQEFTKSKTYYFFGKKYSQNKFRYACYRVNDQVFYFDINDKKNERNLEDFEDINALQELKSFIILRKFESKNSEFGNIIYPKIDEIIGKLKLKAIQI